MNKYLSDTDMTLLRNGFGQGYFELIEKKLEKISKKWQLSNFQIIPSFSANLVMTCMIEGRSKGVLKLSARDSENFKYEPKALKVFNHPRLVALLEEDRLENLILLENLEPGTCLRKVESLEERVDVFLGLYKDLHKIPRPMAGFPSYLDWVIKITNYMKDHHRGHPLTVHMDEAYHMIQTIWDETPEKTLLHGDFHHDNILQTKDNTYKIIDPKGVSGPVIFDLPRFILNEFDDHYEDACIHHIKNLMNMIGAKLNISRQLLWKTLFIETSMAACWSLQDDPSLKDNLNLLKMVEVSKNI